MIPGGEPRYFIAAVIAMALFGAVIGLTVKKVAKLVALVLGVQFAAYRYLESKGMVQLRVGSVGTDIGQAGAAGVGEVSVASVLSTSALGAGFAVGFLFGIVRG